MERMFRGQWVVLRETYHTGQVYDVHGDMWSVKLDSGSEVIAHKDFFRLSSLEELGHGECDKIT